jgi:hypothetical protein
MSNRRAVGIAIVGLLGALIALRSVSRADVIQKWKTPKGGLYFGDRPPPGSTKVGQEGSSEPSDSAPTSNESPPSSDLDGKLSVEASRQRAAIEKALNASAVRLEEVKKKIAETERLPDSMGTRMTSYADGTPTKPEALRALKAEKRKSLEEISAQWKKFDELNARVQKDHGGSAPIWWRSKLSCSACPSRSEAEKALE